METGASWAFLPARSIVLKVYRPGGCEKILRSFGELTSFDQRAARASIITAADE
jgi:hypothetical protein